MDLSHISSFLNAGNLLRTPDGKLAFIDFGMMADIDEEDRYGLFGLVIGLQNKDLPLVTENLLKVRTKRRTNAFEKEVRKSLQNCWFALCSLGFWKILRNSINWSLDFERLCLIAQEERARRQM